MLINKRNTIWLMILGLLLLVFPATAALAQDDGQTDAFEFTGIVESMNLDSITVNQQVIDIRFAELNTPIELGAVVKIEGGFTAEGAIVARQVDAPEADDVLGAAEIVGTLQSFDGFIMQISGQSIDASTAELSPGLALGATVKVHATVTATGTWNAREAELSDDAVAPVPTDGVSVGDDNSNTNDNVGANSNDNTDDNSNDNAGANDNTDDNSNDNSDDNGNDNDDDDDRVSMRIEGPVVAVAGNVLTVNGIEVELDSTDPLLSRVRIGDILEIEGDFRFEIRDGRSRIRIRAEGDDIRIEVRNRDQDDDDDDDNDNSNANTGINSNDNNSNLQNNFSNDNSDDNSNDNVSGGSSNSNDNFDDNSNDNFDDDDDNSNDNVSSGSGSSGSSSSNDNFDDNSGSGGGSDDDRDDDNSGSGGGSDDDDDDDNSGSGGGGDDDDDDD